MIIIPSPKHIKQVTKECTGNILWHLLFTNLEIQKQGSPLVTIHKKDREALAFSQYEDTARQLLTNSPVIRHTQRPLIPRTVNCMFRSRKR